MHVGNRLSIRHPALSSRSNRSASHIRARVVASVVRWRASLLSTAFMAGGRRIFIMLIKSLIGLFLVLASFTRTVAQERRDEFYYLGEMTRLLR